MMPETQSSSSSAAHEQHPRRQAARDARSSCATAFAQGASTDDLRRQKEQALGVIYRILCIHLGTPPQNVRLAVDRQGQDLPPRRRDDAAAVRRAVRRAAGRRLRLPRARPARDIAQGQDVHGRVPRQRRRGRHRQVPQRRHRPDEGARAKAILGGEPVWFGCDTGKMSRRDLGIWDKDLLRLRLALRHQVRHGQGDAPQLPRDADDARDAVHRRRHRGRQGASLARREQLGREKPARRASSS